MLLAAKVGLAVLSFTLFSGFGDRFEGGFGGGFRGGFGGGFGRASGGSEGGFGGGFRGGFGGGFGRASGGSAPKAPEDAVAGIYMNLDKGVGNCLEVANLIADESPVIRNELRNGIVEFKKILKDKLGAEDALRWAFLTIHFDASRMANDMDPGLGCAVCVKDAGKALAFLTETADAGIKISILFPGLTGIISQESLFLQLAIPSNDSALKKRLKRLRNFPATTS